jgi:hypothetical protein
MGPYTSVAPSPDALSTAPWLPSPGRASPNPSHCTHRTVGSQVTLSDAVVTVAEDKIIYYVVELFHEHNRRQSKLCQRVEITVTGNGLVVRAQARGPDFYTPWLPRSPSSRPGYAAVTTAARCTTAIEPPPRSPRPPGRSGRRRYRRRRARQTTTGPSASGSPAMWRTPGTPGGKGTLRRTNDREPGALPDGAALISASLRGILIGQKGFLYRRIRLPSVAHAPDPGVTRARRFASSTGRPGGVGVYSRIVATSEVARRAGVGRGDQAGPECSARCGGPVVGWSIRTPVGNGPTGFDGRRPEPEAGVRG